MTYSVSGGCIFIIAESLVDTPSRGWLGTSSTVLFEGRLFCSRFRDTNFLVDCWLFSVGSRQRGICPLTSGVNGASVGHGRTRGAGGGPGGGG